MCGYVFRRIEAGVESRAACIHEEPGVEAKLFKSI